ncbi:MAG: Do family serine endopeptidase, partial [Gammaproteobacteria bacterium]|nr:Do family serine endopeptidase [Gammaproteobacteria bacterium]
CLPLTSMAHIPSSIDKQSMPSLAPMLTQITPAIVNVAVEKDISFGDIPIPYKDLKKLPSKMLGVGSGVIINAQHGLIVTNAHVVNHAKVMIVTLKDGRRFRARLIGKDDGFDIAIIQIKADDLKQIQFGNSDQLKVGNFVAAIGSPFGLDQTVTSGVISALNRSTPKIEGFQSFIQTDASINPGNSGGALVDLDGHLIGLNTAILAPTDASAGIGFAIPSNMVKSVVQQLLKYGKVERGMLGVIAQNIGADLAEVLNLRQNNGTLVSQVMPGSPAEKAGLKTEDIIESVDNEPMHSAVQLHNTLGMMRPGTELKMAVLRNHKILHLTATVADPNKIKETEVIPFISGIQLRQFNELEGDGSMLNGVIVTGVNGLSSAALSGLEPGDVIVQANGKQIHSVDALKKLAQSHPKHLLLKVNRNNLALFLVLQA